MSNRIQKWTARVAGSPSSPMESTDMQWDENPPSELCSAPQSCDTDELLTNTSHYLGLGSARSTTLCARGREADDCMGLRDV
ncbi:hypothetical protein PILCRDRAFT_824620 [Piloderma croceum F 1598]|uniref:Uncharacterized protein n=1 Tax=Piloderma croceum (strain F 1598) TaxID=765440 RepID=A0A0C3FE16_PILCF|nr:hypothetical protein PILCRDRAFT_824620 [Piloderma croceum F 1598]